MTEHPPTPDAEEPPDLSEHAPGKIGGKTFNEWPKWEGQGLPLFDNCDMRNPRQAFLPFFTAMPGVNGAPLILGVEYWELQSWRMWLLGALPTGRKRKLKYEPPTTMTNAWTAQGQWVDIAKPDVPRKTLKQVIGELPQRDRMEMRHMMLEEMGLEADRAVPIPDTHYRVDDLARRLELPLMDLQVVLARFGIAAREPGDLVERGVVDRVMAHLGL